MMGTRVTDPGGQSVLAARCVKTGKLRLAVVEVILDGTIAWCEIAEGENAGYMILRKVRDLVKISYLH